MPGLSGCRAGLAGWALLACWCGLLPLAGAQAFPDLPEPPDAIPAERPSGPTREEIQAFFQTHPANSARSQAWVRQYQGQTIHWRGEVYRVRHVASSFRVEIMVRVLPQSFLYDTIVALEGDTAATTLDPRIRRGTRIRFEGHLAHGLDFCGVKQVTVIAPSPGAVRVEAGEGK